jgi:hypothetical protein
VAASSVSFRDTPSARLQPAPCGSEDRIGEAITVARRAQHGKTWTLAGAARAAREARIATAHYLRTAQVARLWERGNLVRAYQIQLANYGDPAEARAALFGGMGYRPPFPADWPVAAQMVLGDEARYLAEADLYILTPQMCDVVVAAAQALTRKDLELVGEDDLPG